MSTNPALICLYASSNMVSGDGISTGGAVNFAQRVGFSDFTSTGSGAWVSSSASDTTGVTGTIIGRDSTGAVQTQTAVLNGTTAASGSIGWQRLLQGQFAGTAVGDLAFLAATPIITGTAQSAAVTSGTTPPYVQLQSGQGASGAVENILRMTNNLPSGVEYQLRRVIALSGDVAYVNEDWSTTPTSSSTYALYTGMLFERAPNSVTGLIRIFDNCAAAASGGSATNFYAKAFVVNNSTATALTQAGITLSGTTPGLPPGATLEFAIASGQNDSQTIANRQTYPAGVTFTSGALPQSSGVTASGGNLPPGSAPNSAGAQAIWFNLYLPAGAQPFNGLASVTTSGTST